MNWNLLLNRLAEGLCYLAISTNVLFFTQLAVWAFGLCFAECNCLYGLGLIAIVVVTGRFGWGLNEGSQIKIIKFRVTAFEQNRIAQ